MQNANPLSKHFRQPKIYINLPSKGMFYEPGSLEKTETGEYPVLPMTAKDEIMIKTPDALLNGESTVQVIQSCMPNIKNAWNIPSVDIDAILLAIRIATYGEMMEVSSFIKELDDDRTFEINLRPILDNILAQTYDPLLTHGDFTFETHPLTYKKFTETALKTFEEQRLFRVVNDDEMSEEEKIRRFNESFTKLTDMNITQIYNTVAAIKYADEDPVVDRAHINEFLENADTTVYKKLIQHTDEQRKKFSVQPFKANFSQEDIEAGAPTDYSIPITFDQSSFFG